MALGIRGSSASDANTHSYQKLVVDGLGEMANTYYQIDLINSTTGVRTRAGTHGGGNPGSYYSAAVTFYVSANTANNYYAELRHKSGSALTRVPTSGFVRYTSPPAPALPSTPTVYSSSVNDKSITWRITAGSNTSTLYIDRTWSTETSRSVTSGETFYWTYDAPSYSTQYGIRVRGYNSNGFGSYTGWSYATTAAAPKPVAKIVGLFTTQVTTNSFRLSWDSTINATTYQVSIKLRDSATWSTTYSMSQTSYNFTDLTVATYYTVRVRGYYDSIYGEWSDEMIVRTQDNVPTPLSWRVRTSGSAFDLTAKEWNDLTSKINAWRTHRGLVNRTLTAAVTGNNLTAAMFNQVATELRAVSTPISPPADVGIGDAVTAPRINGLCSSIDSMKPNP